ncbi:NAD(P)/FAD-dependent oxidoreductase [Methylopila sp. Yamaguchi]|uniref:NAD(P)/FAD-dependent oxidoreductase n=1 Tax=Methylopila sp. Yamaguchi TaxID=1437817 RepID=UPI00135A6E0F|nr:FAD-dependent oxidoreductase [Methylopila sp. Yamaguchi]
MTLHSLIARFRPPPPSLALEPAPALADGYDVVVIGGGALALAVARACARQGAGVALLAPGEIAASAAERAFPLVRGVHHDRARAEIQADAPAQFAKLARRLSPSPWPEVVGCLTLAPDGLTLEALRRASAAAKPLGARSWMVPAQEAQALSPVLHDNAAPALFEPAAAILWPDVLAVALARDARSAGATLRANAPAMALARDGAAAVGVEIDGRFIRAGAVVLADDASAIRLVREGRGRLSLTRDERMTLVTQPGAAAIGAALVADDLAITRDLTGAITLSGPLGAETLAEQAMRLAPALGGLEIASVEPVTVWRGVDGRAQVGPAEIDGLWLALGFGRDALSPALAVADHLAGELAGRTRDAAFDAFAPTRRASPRNLEFVR